MLLENITQLCKANKVTIAKLERETGISNGTIGRWGTSSPSVENVRKVAEYFGTTVDALIMERKAEAICEILDIETPTE